MTDIAPRQLYLMAAHLDDFADRLAVESTRIQGADAATGWQSRSAAQYRDQLTWLRSDLLVAAHRARVNAEQFRSLAWAAAKDR